MLGQRIRTLRKSLGLSQEELAARSEIHTTYLSSLECGKRNPTIGVIFSIAHGLGLPASELLTISPRGKSPTKGGVRNS
jgi:transcriptional regulator with XRE-family HTH domain